MGASMAVLVLLILLVQPGSRAEMRTAGPESSSVPVPTNVRIQSYNLNPTLYWDYPSLPQTPVFTVQIKNYGWNTWVYACNNTSGHHCRISNISDPDLPLWGRVKARVGQRESAYVESESFDVCKDGKIGPPGLTVVQEEDHIIVDVDEPTVHLHREQQVAMYDACYLFDYTVYVKVNRSEATSHSIKGADCLDTPCLLKIPVPSLNSEYCVSAEGFLEQFKTERSEEKCITIHSSSIEGSIWIPIVAALLLFAVLILVFACCYFKKNPCKRKNTMLPKSLLSVVKNATSEIKPESKYVSLISSYQPITITNEGVVSGEEVSAGTVPHTCTEGGLGLAEHSGESSPQTEVLVLEESVSDLALGRSSLHSSSDQSEACGVIVSSYHSRNGSDSGIMGSDSFIADPEIPPSNKTELKTGQEAIMQRSAPNSFGYDKPHVLVDLLVGDPGDRETLVGYRLTTDSKEFS